MVERWTGRGTQQGPFQGLPASGKQVTVPGFVYLQSTQEGNLAQQWTEEQAENLLWASLSLENWEKLAMQSGWSLAHNVAEMKQLLRQKQ